MAATDGGDFNLLLRLIRSNLLDILREIERENLGFEQIDRLMFRRQQLSNHLSLKWECH